MIAISIAFCWLLLALPGLALLRRFCPGHLNQGWLSNLTLSYLYSFALLMPVSVVCYLLKLPLVFFSTAIVITVCVAFVWLLANKCWRRISFQVGLVEAIGTAVVLGDAWLGGRVGAIASADARFHIARIRMLLEHGFNNWDPYFHGQAFSRVYHTNILHALVAAITQITDLGKLNVWAYSLPWAKVITVSGIYYLSISVFRSKRAAWLSTILAVAYSGPVDFQLYPNQIALLWLLSLIIAFAIRYLRCPSRWRLIHLACACALIGQVHSLYAVIASLALFPVLLVRLSWAWWKAPNQRWRTMAVLGCLLLPTPFLLASKYVERSQPVKVQYASKTAPQPRLKRELIYLNDRLFMADPAPFGNPRNWQFWVVPVLAIAWFNVHRKSVTLLAACAAAIGFFLFIPFLASGAVKAMGTGAWVITRLNGVFVLGMLCALPSAVLVCVGGLRRRTGVLFILCMLALVAGVAERSSTASKRWGWHRYITVAKTGSRNGYLSHLKKKQAFLGSAIPSGSVILASKTMAPDLVMLHSVYVLITKHSSPGVAGRVERSKDHRILWSTESTWQSREAVLKRYGIRHVVLPNSGERTRRKIYGAHATGKHEGVGLVVLHL